MALRDMWSFDNAPVGTNLTAGSTSNVLMVNSSANPYTYYTGNPGMLYPNATGSTGAVTSDGFLTITRNSSGLGNVLLVYLAQFQNWVTSTKFWIGFRTKANYAATTATTGKVFCSITGGYNQNLGQIFVNESDLVSPANTELYVELFFDTVALTYSLYIGGVFIRTAAFTSAVFNSTLTVQWDTGGTATVANSTRGYRDFYFIDVDSVDTTRLGPIRSTPAVLGSASGSEYTLNGSPASLLAALNTPLQNPPVATPNAQAPSDNQILTLGLSTSIATGQPIVAVQNQMTTGGDATGLYGFTETLSQASNQLALGAIAGPINSNRYNKRSPILTRVAPDGGIWTPAKVNASSLILTPKQLNTVLLMHMDDYTDDTGRQWTLNGNGLLSATQIAMGTQSFNPSSSGFFSVASDPSLVLGSAFTVEFWAYRTAALGDTTVISSKTANSTTGQTTIGQQASMGLGVYLTDGAGWKQLAPAGAVTLNKWIHYAVVYANGVYTGYVGGVAQGTLTSALTFGLSGSTWTIGGNQYNSSSQFPGYLDEIRVSNVARYTTSFQPPAAPFLLD